MNLSELALTVIAMGQIKGRPDETHINPMGNA